MSGLPADLATDSAGSAHACTPGVETRELSAALGAEGPLVRGAGALGRLPQMTAQIVGGVRLQRSLRSDRKLCEVRSIKGLRVGKAGVQDAKRD
jgi:hypothetical protein